MGDPRLKPACPTQPEHRFPKARLRLVRAHDERLLVQPLQGHMAQSDEGMLGGQHGHERLAEEKTHLQLLVLHGQEHETQVEAAFAHGLALCRAGMLEHFHLDIRCGHAQRFQRT